MRSTAFSILLLFGFLPCSALDPAKALTQYGHDLWTADDGLPVTSVEVVAQMPDGYLWSARKTVSCASTGSASRRSTGGSLASRVPRGVSFGYNDRPNPSRRGG